LNVVRKGGTVAQFAEATAKVRQTARRQPDDMRASRTRSTCCRLPSAWRKSKGEDPGCGKGWLDLNKFADQTAGIECVNIPFAEVNAAWEAADQDQAKEIAERWRKAAPWSKMSIDGDARPLGSHVPRAEGCHEQAPRHRHHDQLPWAVFTAGTSTPIRASASTNC
jgi:hypothetical protein